MVLLAKSEEGTAEGKRGKKAVCSVIMVLLIFRAFLVRPPEREGEYLSKAFLLSLLGSSTSGVLVFYILWYNLYTTSFACKFHAIFAAPPMIPQNPNHFAHCGNPPKTQNKKEGYCKKSDLGWSFSQRNIKTLQKKEEWKKTPLAVRDEQKRKNKKSKSRWQGTSQTNPLRT